MKLFYTTTLFLVAKALASSEVRLLFKLFGDCFLLFPVGVRV